MISITILFQQPSFTLANNFCTINNSITNWIYFNAYAISSMKVARSDFQGLTGAGQTIDATNFYFGPKTVSTCGITVAIGNNFHGKHGSIEGILDLSESKKASYSTGKTHGFSNFRIEKVKKTSIVDHDSISRNIHGASEFYRQLQPSPDTLITLTTFSMKIQLGKSNVQVVNLNSNNFRSLQKIFLEGSRTQTLIINVDGENIELNNFNLEITDLPIRNIIWNFYSAQSLSISNLGGTNTTYRPETSINHYDFSLGLQGYVLAPQARVDFNTTKITGSLIAKSIFSSKDHTGQINIPPETETTSPCLNTNFLGCETN
jgi:choice-of-anchor A domain-containing protein